MGEEVRTGPIKVGTATWTDRTLLASCRTNARQVADLLDPGLSA